MSIVSIIILTLNEELKIENCLIKLQDLADDIFIVDSGSTDRTLEIARKYTDNIYSNKFENYSRQRNWAFDNLPIKSEWILNLDADHRVSDELRQELVKRFSHEIPKEINGFMLSRRTVFMGKWIRHGGHYPAYHAILFRKGHGRCENRKYDQHFVVNGKTEILNGDIIDIVTDDLSTFVFRHNGWSDLEADEQTKKLTDTDQIKPKLFGNPIERKRFFRANYNNLPLFIRPLLYFLYRYFFRLGFLDGKEGLIFHVLQGFWFRFLIDAKIYERKKREIS